MILSEPALHGWFRSLSCWPALLVLTDVDSGVEFAVAAGLLAAANAVGGVLADLLS